MACSNVVCWRDADLHALLHEAPEVRLFFKSFFHTDQFLTLPRQKRRRALP